MIEWYRLLRVFSGELLGSFVTEFGVTSCCLSPDGDMVVMGLPGCTGISTLLPVGEGGDGSCGGSGVGPGCSVEGEEGAPGESNDRGPRRESLVFGDAANKGKVFRVGEGEP